MIRTLSILVLLLLAAAPRPAFALHPQDGPHADIRIEITEQAVEWSVQVNLAFADFAAPAFREDPNALHPVEEPALRESLERFFRSECLVAIDGIEVAPTFTDFHVVRGDPDQLGLFPRAGMRGLIRANLRLRYPALEQPRSVRFVWPAYPPDFVTYPEDPDPPPAPMAVQLTAFGALEIIQFTHDEPEYVWHWSGDRPEDRFLEIPKLAPPPAATRIPILAPLALVLLALAFILRVSAGRWSRPAVASLLISTLFALIAPPSRHWSDRLVFQISADSGPALPDESEALEIFRRLHQNIYRAFDYTEETDIYDALARSVDGPLLDRLYSQIFTSLIMQEEGGAVSRVQKVTPVTTDVLTIGRSGDPPRPGFSVRARWQVLGIVYHWGHTHSRTNEYEADYTVAETPDGWRITGHAIREQWRVDAEPLDPAQGPIRIVPGEEF